MLNELELLRQFLIDLLTEARERDRMASGAAHTAIDANIRLLERMVAWLSNSIKQGVMDMEKAKSEIKVLDEGVIEELGRARQASPVTTKIIELATKLKQGRFIQVDPEGIEPSHFVARTWSLKAQGTIPSDVKPKTRVNGKAGLFLVRLTKEQMSAEPKRKQKVNGHS